MNDSLFNFEKSIKIFSDIGNRIQKITGDYNSQTKVKYKDKEQYINTLNAVRNYVFDFYSQ